MAEIVNLRRARKAKARTEAEQAAAANRSRHGQSRAVRASSAAEQALLTRRHAGHRRAPDPDPDSSDGA
jgi:hypothetical protein